MIRTGSPRVFVRAAGLVLVLVPLSGPAVARAQVDMVAPGERLPLTRLPTCVDGLTVGSCFDFERGDLDDWRLADWATESDGYVRGRTRLTTDTASSRNRSLAIETTFENRAWSALALELRADVDLSAYDGIRADLLAPPDTTLDLSVRFVVLAGPEWRWLETRESFPLTPGRWVTSRAPLEAAAWTDPTYGATIPEHDWTAYLRTVHKIVVRIESSRAGSTGPIVLTIDDIWFPER